MNHKEYMKHLNRLEFSISISLAIEILMSMAIVPLIDDKTMRIVFATANIVNFITLEIILCFVIKELIHEKKLFEQKNEITNYKKGERNGGN